MGFRKIKILPLLVCVWFFAASCVLENGPTGHEAGTSVVRFTLSVPGAVSPASTRTMSENGENYIGNLRVLLFNVPDKKLVCIHTPQQTAASGVWEVELPTGKYDVMVLANAGHSDWLNNLAPGSLTWGQLTDRFAFNLAEKWSDRWAIAMFGYKRGVTIGGNTSFTGADAVCLHRAIARIELLFSPQATGADNGNFALREVYLCNFNTRSQVVPLLDAAHWRETAPGQGVALAASLPADPKAVIGIDNALKYDSNDGPGFTSSGVIREICVYEASGGDASSRATNLCLVFGGSYRGAPTTYYRLDFIDNSGGKEVYLDLLRNHIYEVTVNRISGEGFPTPGQAFESNASDIETSILLWNDEPLAGPIAGALHGITFETASGGSARVDRPKAQAGETVTVAAVPGPGMRFKEWSFSPAVTMADGSGVRSNPAKFIMPGVGVSIAPSFEAVR